MNKKIVNQKYTIKEYDELQSTHLYVKENQNKLESGTVIIANKQTSGIGTHGRIWYTGRNNIAMSILYKPNCDITKLDGITINIAKSIKEAINELYNINLEIKYPNDLLLSNKKICGILTEINTISKKVNYLIISIGFNVNEINFDNEITKIATSLKKEYKKDFDKQKIIIKILENIEKLINKLNII